MNSFPCGRKIHCPYVIIVSENFRDSAIRIASNPSSGCLFVFVHHRTDLGEWIVTEGIQNADLRKDKDLEMVWPYCLPRPIFVQGSCHSTTDEIPAIIDQWAKTENLLQGTFTDSDSPQPAKNYCEQFTILKSEIQVMLGGMGISQEIIDHIDFSNSQTMTGIFQCVENSPNQTISDRFKEKVQELMLINERRTRDLDDIVPNATEEIIKVGSGLDITPYLDSAFVKMFTDGVELKIKKAKP